MPRPSGNVRMVFQRVLLPITLAVAAAMCVLVGLLLWTTTESNTEAAVRERAQVGNALQGFVDGFGTDLDGTARWDDAIVNLWLSYDAAWAEANVAVWLIDTHGHQEAFILSPDDALLFSRTRDVADGAGVWRSRHDLLRPLIRRVRERYPPLAEAAIARGGLPPVTREVELRSLSGQPTLIGVSAVVPDVGKAGVPPGQPVLIASVRTITPKDVATIGQALLLNDLTMARAGDNPGGRASYLVRDADGEALVSLTWTPERPGGAIAARVLPLTLAAIAGVAALTWAVLHHVRLVAHELAASEARSHHLAMHDPLSGLPNRTLFVDRLGQALHRLRRGQLGAAMLYIDLDRFKEVNDSLGHEAGDELIRQMASRLGAQVRGADTLARIGGDEFAVLQVDIADPAEIEALCRRLLDAASPAFRLVGQEVFVTVSIGVAVAGNAGEDATGLMRHADIALYRAKAEGRNRFRFFEPAMDESAKLRRIVEAELRAAIGTKQLQVHYQPIVGVKDGRIRAVEALARWNHPTRGRIEPAEFVPIAEQTGLIVALGEAVLRRACADGAIWPGITVAVNLSASQIRAPGFDDLILDILRGSGMAPDRLELEVTEGVVLDPSPQVTAVLSRLRRAGVRLALDDFGTGYSSLSYFHEFKFDKLKIDKSFVQAAPNSPDAAAIVRALIGLGRALKLDVTAEGVEQRQQHRFLHDAGCDEMQGFLFSEPVGPATIAELLRRNDHRAGREFDGAPPPANEDKTAASTT